MAPLWCALLPMVLTGCPVGTPQCPEATITFDPPEIPPGVAETTVIVDVSDPRPELGLEVTTETSAVSGRIADPFARETTYACAFDVVGPVEVCATATYVGGDGQSEDPNVGTSYQYLGKPHIRLSSPVECAETRCTTVICPEDKNTCPAVSSLTVEPTVVPDGGTATITVAAEDRDDNPVAPLVTTLRAVHGTIADPNVLETTYTCDPAVGGVIEICVVASDGDCEVERCINTVRCPGDPPDNTCPSVEEFTATPMTIPAFESMTAVRVDVVDPDDFPEPSRTELSSDTGVFDDRFVTETTFTCGESGPLDLCVEVTDGDSDCDKSRCITVQCPSTIRANLCPMLFVINSIPRDIPPGQNTTRIETRAQDTDGLPLPLVLTLRALWGTIENDENISGPTNIVFQNATYVCDRPGPVEICVDATDGACLKTQCDVVTCPADIPPP